MVIEKDGYKQGTEVEDLDKILQSEEDFQKQKRKTSKKGTTEEIPEEIKSIPIEEIKERCLILISSWSGFMEDWEKNLKKKFTEIPLEGDVFRNGSPLETEPEPDFKDSFGGYYLFKRFLKNSLQIRDSLNSNSLPEDEIRSVYDELESLTGLLLFALTGNADGIVDEIERERIRETNRKNFKGERLLPESVEFLNEIKKIAKEPKSGQIQISKDIFESQFAPSEDLLLCMDDKVREHIKTLQKEGKLLAGTTEGLYGGDAYLKVFTIALAQTLNEQSRYYKTEEDWGGVPQKMIDTLAGKNVRIEKKENIIIKGEERSFPYVLIYYEDLAKKMSSTGEISGGKDINFLRDFINGGAKLQKDKKTGKERPVKVPGLVEKQYLLSLGNSIGGLPLLQKEFTFYSNKDGKEIGFIGRLSLQFSKSTRLYTSLRSDTIQLLGGGRQRGITMFLIDYLLYNRGVTQKGRKPGEFAVRKTDLLEKIATGKDYQKRPGLKETHFRDAIQKAIDAKILISGRTRDGSWKGYREEKNPGGEVLSVFLYNDFYLKCELLPFPED